MSHFELSQLIMSEFKIIHLADWHAIVTSC